jgi:hypothetical protein
LLSSLRTAIPGLPPQLSHIPAVRP